MGLSSSTSFFPVVASTARAAEEVTLLVSIALAPLLSIANSTPAFAQSPDPPIELTVSTGRPLEVVLDQRITVKAE